MKATRFFVRFQTLLLLAGLWLTGTAGAQPTPMHPEGFPPEALAYRNTLPSLLIDAGGQPITQASAWPARRRFLLRQVLLEEYGIMPAPPAHIRFETLRVDEAYFEGEAVLKVVRIHYGPGGAPPIDLMLIAPADDHPAPVFLGINFLGNHTTIDDPAIPLSPHWIPERGNGVIDNRATEASRGTSDDRWPYREIIARGYAVATFYAGDVDPDRDDFTDGIHPHFPIAGTASRTETSWGTLAAWAYGLHRAVDYLQQEPLVDRGQIAVMGHSRNGKAALLAAATDERIALTVSNQSGCGGAALSRRKTGETVKAINTAFPHWFNRRFRAYNDNEDAQPVDQHTLLALIAPRPLLVASAEEDLWADPAGEFLALVEAEPVYRLLDAGGLSQHAMPPVNRLLRGTLGYHIRPGGHGVGLADWTVFMDFADDHFRLP